MNFKAILFSVLALVAGSALADQYPTFTGPVADQNGIYNITLAEAPANVVPFAGGVLEVLTEGATVDGYTVPQDRYLVWGTIQTGDAYLVWSTDTAAIFSAGTLSSVRVAKPTLTGNILLGDGWVIFDPESTGDGHTFDLRLVFTQPVTFLGTPRTSLNLRLLRQQSNALVFACDRTNVSGGFSPPPPNDLCN